MTRFIHSFIPYQGQPPLAQEDATKWLQDYHGLNDRELFEKYAIRPEDISSRSVYASGIGDQPYSGEPLYQKGQNPLMGLRSEHAQRKIEEIFESLYQGEEKSPEHLCHVSCTHYQSPSAAQKMVVAKEWGDHTQVTHLYHMGCYASLPAIRVAGSYISAGAQNTHIVHTELCSFHLNKDNANAEQTIMKTLFADGAIKYLVSDEENFKNTQKAGLEILAQKEVLLPNTQNEMSWKVGEHGFAMTLTKSVPLILAKKIERFMRDLFSLAGLDYDLEKNQSLFAVHPGGPKIIELVEKMLKLDPSQVEHSKKILKARGNMSSATIPHIWNEILIDPRQKDQTYVATVAFGPGLTITGAVLKICRP